MASYSWNDALNFVSQRNPRLVGDASGILIVDQAASAIWNFADWRWSLGKVPPFYMIPGVQDYPAPYAVIPADFLGLRSADLVYNETEPATRYPPLTIDRYLPLTPAIARPTALSYEATISGWRLHPRPPSGIGPMAYQVEATYKKTPTKITEANLGAALPFGDLYFSVACDAIEAFLKQSADAFGKFRSSLADMAAEEVVNLGQQPVSPREPLVGW